MSDWFNQVYLGSAESMSAIPDASIDALITDPPAGIAFMGKAWDGDKGGRAEWCAWLAGIMREAYRTMKPGAHGFVWALPRTAHWTATALEDAGFEIRDVVVHLFGSGFPKSLDVSKAIDKAAGATREVVATERMKRMASPIGQPGSGYALQQPQIVHEHTRAATDNAKTWDGWGTALKPAAEHWILIRKPIAERNVAENVLRFGTGAINIDASRIAGAVGNRTGAPPLNRVGEDNHRPFHDDADPSVVRAYTKGRWPANVTLSHNPNCVVVGQRVIRGDERDGGGVRGGGFYDVGSDAGDGKPCGPLYSDETVDVFDCSPSCAVAALDVQSGVSQSGLMLAGTPRRNRMGYNGAMPENTAAADTYGDRGGGVPILLRRQARARREERKPRRRRPEHASDREADRAHVVPNPNDNAAGRDRARSIHRQRDDACSGRVDRPSMGWLRTRSRVPRHRACAPFAAVTFRCERMTCLPTLHVEHRRRIWLRKIVTMRTRLCHPPFTIEKYDGSLTTRESAESNDA